MGLVPGIQFAMESIYRQSTNSPHPSVQRLFQVSRGRRLKRAMDVTLAILLLALLAPLLLLLAILVRLSTRASVLYRAEVVGLAGVPFTLYKFRTMIPRAKHLKPILQTQNEVDWPLFKMRHDPRVTPLGRVLRKYSLDELPQLWNIIRGEMSFVGPRPVLTSEWEHFTEWQRQKLSILPGAVSLWHVRGQPRELQRWIELDLEYQRTRSTWLDLTILMEGAWFMLSGKNC